MPLTVVHTRTYTLLDAWAETVPWDCLIRPTTCCAGPEHDHNPMVNDPCAMQDCGKPLLLGETCYAVTELDRVTGPPPQNPHGRVREREQWVCWRHVRPDEGPISAD